LSKAFLISCCVFFATLSRAQSALESFKERPIIYADLGYNVNPFRINYPLSSQVNELAYKNNFSPILAFGFAYKWFHLRLGFPVIGNLRSPGKYGKTTQYNFAYDLTYKNVWYDFEFKSTFGYAVKWPNIILPKAYSINAMFNAWYFGNPDFQMIGLLGKRAHYNQEILTWYLKGTVNFFGSSDQVGSLIPLEFQNSTEALTQIRQLQAFDFGAAPGLAYVSRKKNWQIGGWAGVGPVLQVKSYETTNSSKVNLGIAPRYDLRLMGGYSSDEKFFFLVTDFDNKSMRFDSFKYRQIYFALKLVAGYRFAEK
jgi:hypothetical protein